MTTPKERLAVFAKLLEEPISQAYAAELLRSNEELYEQTLALAQERDAAIDSFAKLADEAMRSRHERPWLVEAIRQLLLAQEMPARRAMQVRRAASQLLAFVGSSR